jgi:hypothetical protein
MDITVGKQILEAAVFGAFFSALYYLIVGWNGWRPWLAAAVVLAGLCYVALFGVVRV